MGIYPWRMGRARARHLQLFRSSGGDLFDRILHQPDLPQATKNEVNINGETKADGTTLIWRMITSQVTDPAHGRNDPDRPDDCRQCRGGRGRDAGSALSRYQRSGSDRSPSGIILTYNGEKPATTEPSAEQAEQDELKKPTSPTCRRRASSTPRSWCPTTGAMISNSCPARCRTGRICE